MGLNIKSSEEELNNIIRENYYCEINSKRI